MTVQANKTSFFPLSMQLVWGGRQKQGIIQCTFSQLSPEFFNFFLEFSQQGILWIFIDLCLVLYILCTIGISTQKIVQKLHHSVLVWRLKFLNGKKKEQTRITRNRVLPLLSNFDIFLLPTDLEDPIYILIFLHNYGDKLHYWNF